MLKQTKEKCLVTEAQEKCQCDDCKKQREWVKMMVKWQLEWEALKIWMDNLERAKNERRNNTRRI
jgi:hypothetical protein